MGKNSQSIGRSMVEVGGLVVVSASTAFFFLKREERRPLLFEKNNPGFAGGCSRSIIITSLVQNIASR